MCQPGVSDDILVLISTRGVEWSVFISKSVFLRVVFYVVGIYWKSNYYASMLRKEN